MSRNLDHFFTANECAEIDTHLDNANLIVNEIESKFNSNNEPLDESNQTQIAEKKEIDFKIQLIHILNRAVVGIKKLICITKHYGTLEKLNHTLNLNYSL